jgi:hypothetical protein
LTEPNSVMSTPRRPFKRLSGLNSSQTNHHRPRLYHHHPPFMMPSRTRNKNF